MKNLIVNADDFGRHRLINSAVEKACIKGVLRSATIMAGGRAFDDAVKLAGRIPTLGVGIHFTLVNGFPILSPHEIPTLVTEDGVFHENYVVFLKKYLQGKISRQEIRAELAAQLEKTQRAGLNLTHFDSHQHLHHIPGIAGIAMELAAKANIPAMRVASTKIFDGELDSMMQLIGRLGLGSLAKYVERKAHRQNFQTPNYFSGIVAGESVDEHFLASIIENMTEGTTEIMLHPGTDNATLQEYTGWQHNFEAELAAVTSPNILKLMAKHDVIATNFSALR